eukprot:4626215-Karenia_brevis.AAC.1
MDLAIRSMKKSKVRMDLAIRSWRACAEWIWRSDSGEHVGWIWQSDPGEHVGWIWRSDPGEH